MLRKLSIAGLTLMASSGLVFADTSDSMSATDAASSGTTDTSMSNTSSGSTTATGTSKTTMHKKHKRHSHKKTHHKRHHHHYSATTTADPAPAGDPDPVASSAPMGSYKGEVPCTPVRNVFMTGPYVGLSVGSRLNYVSTPAVYNGLEGTLFAGYSTLFDPNWYGALEIAIQDSAQITNYTSSIGSAKSSWSYGLSLIPGYLIADNVLAYLRLGIIETRFTTGNNNEFGGQAGLGLQTTLCNNWDLRGEYIYALYNSLSGGGGTPRTQQFNLGLVYKFQF